MQRRQPTQGVKSRQHGRVNKNWSSELGAAMHDVVLRRYELVRAVTMAGHRHALVNQPTLAGARHQRCVCPWPEACSQRPLQFTQRSVCGSIFRRS